MEIQAVYIVNSLLLSWGGEKLCLAAQETDTVQRNSALPFEAGHCLSSPFGKVLFERFKAMCVNYLVCNGSS